MKFIILAGGSGVRLWPVSRDLYPKQLLSLYDEKSLIQNVYKLILSLTKEENIITVTNIRQTEEIRTHLLSISKNPFIVSEPLAKNTLNAVLAGICALNKEKDEIVTILPSDFSISSKEEFSLALKQAENAARKGYIAVVGVKPSYPESGFGYVKPKTIEKSINKIERFIEKPGIIQATEFVESGKYYWNCGIYIAKISVLLEEIKKFEPENFSIFTKDIFDENNKIDYDYYEKLTDKSIDYAIMEKSKKLAFVEMQAQWRDFGAWHEIYTNRKKDDNENVIEGNVLTYNVQKSLIYSSKELVTAASIKNTIIVDTEDALLVCDKNRASDLNKLVKNVDNKYKELTQLRKTVIRPWGIYTSLNQGRGWLTRILTVNPNQKLSVHLHNFRSEHWVVLEGVATVVIDDKIINLEKGTSIDIKIKTKHSLQNNMENPLKILEVQKGEYINEDDMETFEEFNEVLV